MLQNIKALMDLDEVTISTTTTKYLSLIHI